MKNLSTKYLFIALITIFGHSLNSQITLYSTDFGNTANVNPAGWLFSGIDLNISLNTTSSGYNGASGNAYLGEGNSVAFVNTFGTSESGSQTGTSVATLTLSTVGYSSVTLSFGMRKSSSGYNSNATYTLEWSANGSTFNTITYTEAAAGSWGLVSGAGLNLPAGAGNQPVLYLRWTFVRTGTASNFKIDDVSVTSASVATVSTSTITMDVAATTNFLDQGVTLAPVSPFALSGVINDPTDPASTLGLNFIISDSQVPASSLTLTAASSDLAIVPNANILISGSGAFRNIKITSIGVGYSTVTLTVNNGTTTSSYLLNYAASAASSTPSTTFWSTGMSDASDGIPLDNNYFISADDELDVINVYSRSSSGLPLVSFDYTSLVSLPDPSKPETDIEAATTSPTNSNKKYILGSMSTGGSAFTIRPDRNCLMSTLISGTGSLTTFSVQGFYYNLRTALVAWGDSYGYNFSASSAAGIDSKSTSGYAAEGMVFGPDNTTLFIGFRAPMVPVASRTNAVIAPITNFETWFNNGSPAGNPTIGAPIELNLGGRAIRDLVRLSNGTYIIIAGNSASSPITSAIYKWTGNSSDIPVLVNSPINGILNMEGVMEVNTGNQLSMTQLQIISDGGGDTPYGDNVEAKDFSTLSLRKFRVDNLSGIDLCLITASAVPVVSQNGATLTSSPGASYQWYYNSTLITGATSQNYTAISSGNYYVMVTNGSGCEANSAPVSFITTGLTTYSENISKLNVFPNPYSESTSLQLTLASQAKVSIEVYSMLGQKISSVANSNYDAGTWTFNFSAKQSGYSPGVYFVKTSVNNKVSVTRIIEKE